MEEPRDPDLVLATEVRTDDELRLLINSALTGHGAVGVLEAATPEAALPGIPVAPLFVHHTVDTASGARSMALYRVAQDTEDRLERWKPDWATRGCHAASRGHGRHARRRTRGTEDVRNPGA